MHDLRSDLAGAQHQQRINPGQNKQVADKGVAFGTPSKSDEGDRGWRRQEKFQLAAGGNWTSGQMSAWDSFSGGRPNQSRVQRGSVEIDGRGASSNVNQTTASQTAKLDDPTQKLSGWEKLAAVHSDAARFEETHRKAGTRRISPALAFQGPLRV